ncbi:DUF2407 C-terminal domain-containing protein [Plectosphaerella cucumerina]|jgi:hypothetical protein|uniref:DUF2407 C-terminal domain-containing protein n=1 Tax=Plectosphaerella cucumerina TaxID=40658 RepID=A0A8K0X583_9PEZI|nr:DUF2407 C-terminal domain-containing protein [Plectosphaerella cucumerina]
MTAKHRQPPPLLLTIRFSAAIPDIHLDIPSPESTTVVALKHIIRSRLDASHSSHRLRFIYQGKILQDAASLTNALGPVPADRHDDSPPAHDSGKGKAVEGAAPDAQHHRIYIICSTGDPLSASDLSAEAAAALQGPSSPDRSSKARGGATRDASSATTSSQPAPGAPPPPPPRGFDRLIAAGFSTAEVSQLRLQFRDINAQRHTPDTMPSPDTMRNMEDAWMDANAGDAVPGGATTAAAPGAGPSDDPTGAMHEQLDGLVKGMMMGFFWPMGGIAWLTREEGMVAQRWRVWIGFGLTFSVFVGVMRTMFGGEQ